MSKPVSILLPEEIAVLLEQDELLRSMAESLLADELGKLLLKTLVLDKLAESSELIKEDIAELDKRIKRGLRLRIKAKIGVGHE